MDTGHYFADIAAIQADKAFGFAAGDTAFTGEMDIELVAAATRMGAAVADKNIATKRHLGRLAKDSDNKLAFFSPI